MDNWYSQFKEASGVFPIPESTKKLISYLISKIKSESGNPQINIKEELTIKDLIGNYKPKQNSLFSNIYKRSDYPINLIINCFYKPAQHDNISANVGFEKDYPNLLKIMIVFHMREKYYQDKDSWSNEQCVNYFSKAYLSSDNNLQDILEHEFVHPIKEILGYENPGEYVSDVSTKDKYFKYVSQPLEMEQMFINVYNGLVRSIKNKERTSPAFLLIRDMHVGTKNNRPDEVKIFLKRITDILGRIDKENNGDAYCKRITDKARSILQDPSIDVI